MKLYRKRQRAKKCAVNLSAAEARAIDASNDEPMTITPPGWSFVDWAALVFILAMVGMAMWSAFG